MSFMKSSIPSHEGYENKIRTVDTVSDSEDQDEENNIPIQNNGDVAYNAFNTKVAYKPQFGGPFSLLTPTIWPQDILQQLSQPEDSQPLHQFDQYGFIIEAPKDENEEHEDISKEHEDELRQKWISYLEFTYNDEALPRMKWSQIETQIKHTRVLDELVKLGLPSSMRTKLWMRFSKGLTLEENSKWSYVQMCDQSNHVPSLDDKQILRVMPTNACFNHYHAIGIERLRRIVRVIKWLQRSGASPINLSSENVNISLIASYLLLICDEEDAFWLTLSIINELKSFDHQNTLKDLILQHCVIINEVCKRHDIEFSMISSHWFSALFAGFVAKTHILFHFWDLYFYYGSIVLFQVTIGVLLKLSDEVNQSQDSAAVFNTLSDLPLQIKDEKYLLEFWNKGCEYVQYLSTKPMKNLTRANSMLTLPSFTNEQSDGDLMHKNVRQTSMVLEVHEAIAAIGKHFESHEPKFKAHLVPDYNISDIYDDDELDQCQRPRQHLRRAKALIDFQRHDPDELGFRKNDVITIVSEKDEHCWVGELNGFRGWFPAKFVEILDERNGDYSIAGDDRAVPFINDLVRGRLCNAIKAIFTYGMKRTLFVTTHPWIIIESIAAACIESDFNSVYSRLVLTRTFRLDEFARVLTPSEMLYRTIAHINQTHENEAMDVKLRSLICIALNQQILHDWFTIVCATQPHILSKYYHNWSFVNSPVWKLIRAEIKLLIQFTFNLNPNAELPETVQPKSPVSKDGVRDMLVKHHLFSWDI